MNRRARRWTCIRPCGCSLGLCLLLEPVAGPAQALGTADRGLVCETAASAALAECVRVAGIASQRCYGFRAAPCSPGDPLVGIALRHLVGEVIRGCPDDRAAAAAGYGPFMTQEGLIVRLAEACLGEVASVAARSYGGPHGALLAAADPAARQCLTTAAREANQLLFGELRVQSACVERNLLGETCDVAATQAKLRRREALATAAIRATCPDLATWIGMDVPTFIRRAAAQARCLVATSHPDATPLALDCGPRTSVPVPPRGVPSQIVLDGASFGTRCGDGSPYAFWLKLAREGSSLENVVVGLQGGGVCLFDVDCAARFASSPGLFEALSDPLPTSGALSPDPASNPFARFTVVFLPYCTQDIFSGGGTTETFASGLSVERFGAVNLRAALRYVRDVLWSALDSTTPEGYRPDRLMVLFGGVSAGGFGVQSNYHFVLDELRWSHASAVPNASLSLVGGPVPLPLLFVLKQEPWRVLPFLPPYCLHPFCILGEVIHAATSARLGATPLQQILNVSGQFDRIQQETTFFPDDASWINAARETYCRMRGTPNVFYYLPANTEPIHDMLTNEAEFQSRTSDGVVLKDWLIDAFRSPDAVTDQVEEGTLAQAIPGVQPFPCQVD